MRLMVLNGTYWHSMVLNGTKLKRVLSTKLRPETAKRSNSTLNPKSQSSNAGFATYEATNPSDTCSRQLRAILENSRPSKNTGPERDSRKKKPFPPTKLKRGSRASSRLMRPPRKRVKFKTFFIAFSLIIDINTILILKFLNRRFEQY